MRPEARADGSWSVSIDPAWPGFSGHFPNDPVVPAGLLIDWGLHVIAEPAILVRARFTAPLRPGSEAVLTRTALRVAIHCNGIQVAQFQFAAA